MQVETALRTALQLRRYDDILGPVLVYAFLALVGFYSSFYGTCSKVSLICHVGGARHATACAGSCRWGLPCCRGASIYFKPYVVPHFLLCCIPVPLRKVRARLCVAHIHVELVSLLPPKQPCCNDDQAMHAKEHLMVLR